MQNILALTDIDIVNGISIVIYIMGIVLLVLWFIFQKGFKSLHCCPVRRHYLPVYLPFVIIGFWVFSTGTISLLVNAIFKQSEGWIQDFIFSMSIALTNLLMIILMLIIISLTFVRGFKGFGLNFNTFFEDFVAAFVNYIAIMPVVIISLEIVIRIGTYFQGESFQLQTNESLTFLTENPNVLTKTFLIVFIILIVPIFEELLFRGFLQSTLSSLVKNRWISIAVTSLIFTTLHPWMHWPALFFLSLCIGYAYEKSGSLLRSIFIHVLFNGISVSVSLLQGV